MHVPIGMSKRQNVVETLADRIRRGEFEPGVKLAGEHQLAEEFGVSRSTIRQALTELQHRKLITTRSGLGSFVTFQGHTLDRRLGWAQALAQSGLTITTRVIDISAITREEVPALPENVPVEHGIAIRRVRSVTDETGQEIPISFECSTIPATGSLAELPARGLHEESLWTTLRDAGLIATNGTQRVDVIPLDERQAAILQQPVGEAYLRSVRTSFDDSGQFVEHVVSLLDPTRFSLTLDFDDAS